MSPLDAIEIQLLMKAATKPKAPALTAADYKRRQRAKATQADRRPLTAETMDAALLDALSAILQAGDADGIAAVVLEQAASAFHFPPQAEIRLGNRLRTRRRSVTP